jgi:hypothetical protein
VRIPAATSWRICFVLLAIALKLTMDHLRSGWVGPKYSPPPSRGAGDLTIMLEHSRLRGARLRFQTDVEVDSQRTSSLLLFDLIDSTVTVQSRRSVVGVQRWGTKPVSTDTATVAVLSLGLPLPSAPPTHRDGAAPAKLETFPQRITLSAPRFEATYAPARVGIHAPVLALSGRSRPPSPV